MDSPEDMENEILAHENLTVDVEYYDKDAEEQTDLDEGDPSSQTIDEEPELTMDDGMVPHKSDSQEDRQENLEEYLEVDLEEDLEEVLEEMIEEDNELLLREEVKMHDEELIEFEQDKKTAVPPDEEITPEESSDGSQFFYNLLGEKKLTRRMAKQVVISILIALHRVLDKASMKIVLKYFSSIFLQDGTKGIRCNIRQNDYGWRRTKLNKLHSFEESTEETSDSSNEEVYEKSSFEACISDLSSSDGSRHKKRSTHDSLKSDSSESEELNPRLVKYLKRKLSEPQPEEENQETDIEQESVSENHVDDDQEKDIILNKVDEKLTKQFFLGVISKFKENMGSCPKAKNDVGEGGENSREEEIEGEECDSEEENVKVSNKVDDVDEIFEHPLMRVFIYHGPYYRDTIIEHSTMRIKGLVGRLEQFGAAVSDKKWSHVNRLGIRIAGRFIFYCKMTELEFDGEGYDDTSDLAFSVIIDTLRRVRQCIQTRSHLRPFQGGFHGSCFSEAHQNNISYLRLPSSDSITESKKYSLRAQRILNQMDLKFIQGIPIDDMSDLVINNSA